MGSTNRRADREMIDELRRCARGVGFDEQALPELDSEAIDFRAASESFAPVRKLKRADLETVKGNPNFPGMRTGRHYRGMGTGIGTSCTTTRPDCRMRSV